MSQKMRLLTSKDYRICFEEQIKDGVHQSHEER